MLTSLFAMAGFAFAGAITPGPVNVIAMRHGSQSRRWCALFYVLGASISYALVVWIMGLSGQWLLHDPSVAIGASWICAAYLVWLAWRIAQAPVADQSPSAHDNENAEIAEATEVTDPAQTGMLQAFMQGAAIQSFNPKAWLVALSGVGLFVVPMTVNAPSSLLPAALAWFCAVSLIACMLGVGCWAVLGRVLRRWLRTATRQRWFNRSLALVLLGNIAGMLA